MLPAMVMISIGDMPSMALSDLISTVSSLAWTPWRTVKAWNSNESGKERWYNNDSNVLLYVLFLQIGARSPLGSQEQKHSQNKLAWACACARTHPHTHTHSCMRTHTHSHACMPACVCTHTHMNACTHTRAHTHTQSNYGNVNFTQRTVV